MHQRTGGHTGARRYARRVLLGWLGLVAAVAPAAADTGSLFHPEAGRPALRTYAPETYGSHSQVWAMIQHADGLRYFGCYGGVAEFDGMNWRALNLTLGSFRGFAATPDGRIYYTASADLGWIEPAPDGRTQLRSLLPDIPAELGPPGPFAELAVHRGQLHLSTTRGVGRWDGRKFDRTWTLPGESTARLTAVGDRLWFRRMGAAEILELRGEEWVKVVDDPRLAGQPVHFVVTDAAGRPVLGVERQGLLRVDDDGRLTPLSSPADAVLAQAQLYCGLALRDGSIAVGTFSDGLILISPDGASARQLTMADGLPSNLVQGLGTDRDGRLWICTYNGIATLEWPPLFTVFDRRDGLDASMVRSLRRHDGRMVLGGLGGVWEIAPVPAGSLLPPPLRRLSARHVINSDPIAHASGPIHGGPGGLLTLRDGRSEVLLAIQDNIIFLQRAAENPDRLIFAGQRGVGSALYENGAWRLEGYARGPGTTTLVRQTPDGTLWARAVTGDGWRIQVDRLPSGAPDWASARSTPLAEIPGWPAEKSNEWTVSVTPAGLTAFTPQGVLRYDAAAGRFVPDTSLDRSLTPAGALYTLNDDAQGIWTAVFPDGRRPGGRNAMGRFVFGADGRATWVPLREDIARTLGALAAHEVVPDSLHPGIYWLRGLDAVMRLDATRLTPPPPPAAPLLRGWQRGETALALPGAEAPAFAWSREPIAFQFAAPWSEPGASRFEHRLVGFADEWTKAAAETGARFAGLPAGDYRFEVRERDAQGRTGPVRTVAFTLLPPWWETPWARAAYAALIVAAFGLIYGVRVAALNRRRRQLEVIVQERTAELAAARDEAEKASRAKSTFLAHMSHELRTPLNGIIGYAQVLLKDAAVAGTQRERVNIVHASGLHLLRMINEVLDFSKIEAGKIERRDETFHLGQLLRELAVAHAAAAQGRGLIFALDLPHGEPGHVSGDAQKLRQILDNLLSNAVKFTPQGRVTLRVERNAAVNCRAGSPDPAGMVRGNKPAAGSGDPALQSTRAGECWHFTVTDTGVGMDADDLARLFQPFEQARKGRPTEPGTGLGLAITQRLVRLLGGDLQVESSPGRGTTFSFALALPAVDAPRPASRSPFPVTGYAGPRRRIAVVDDHAVNRSLLRDLLEPLGFEIVEFDSAEALLAVAPGALGADLAFLDVKLPGIDGLELARRLRERAETRALPIVFTSASVLTFDHATAAALGCPDFLPKPFAEAQLNELLTRLLDLRWERAGATPPPAAPTAPLPRALIADLLALAESGDIAALRGAIATALGAHPGHLTLKQVESAAASYQLEAVRQLLRAAPTA